MSAAERAYLSFVVAERSELRGRVTRDLHDYLVSLIQDGFPPSLSLAIVDRTGIAVEAFGGSACVLGEPVATRRETCYDLASLTKVVCTVTLAMIAYQRRSLELDQHLVDFLPGYPDKATTIRHLLTHTSGLIDHRPFYLTLQGRAEIEAAVYEEARDCEPGDTVRYSDLNFMLLGWALEECLGAKLDELFIGEVARPLGMRRTCFCPPKWDRRTIAATELDGDQRVMSGLVWGEVHDGNSFALGGVAGHAGLFAPLEDLAVFVRHLLVPEESVLLPETLRTLSVRQAESNDDVRSIGWRLQPDDWGDWPEGTIWHTGFTGTSLLVDFARGFGVVLLTNSVHPRRRLDDQAAVRREVHRLIAEAIG